MKINVIGKTKSDDTRCSKANYTVEIDDCIKIDILIDECESPRYSLISLDDETKDAILAAIDEQLI